VDLKINLIYEWVCFETNFRIHESDTKILGFVIDTESMRIKGTNCQV
jgi:hypothetical protein